MCVVEIDRDTWLPEILRYIVCEDCGGMINPMVVEGQIFGGVVQGIGGVLSRTSCTTTTATRSPPRSWTTCCRPRPRCPTIEVRPHRDRVDHQPGGYKGMGEGGAIGAHAAVANAVLDALRPLGVKATKTPLGPEQIFALVEAAKATA